MTWTLESDMIKGRWEHGSAGTLNAALAICGRWNTETASTSSESFDGTNWTLEGSPNYEVAWLSGSSYLNSALKISGGDYQTDCEQYNGTSWSIIASCNTGRNWHRSNGSENSTLMCGGEISNGSITNTSEEYNGTSWSYSGNLNTERYEHGVAGDSIDALVIGGEDNNDNLLASCENYDGSSFSYSVSLNFSNASFATSGFNTTSDIIIAGGYYGDDNTSQYYNGTTWSQIENLNQGRNSFAGSGTSNALNFGGYANLKTSESYSGYTLQGNVTDIYSNIVSNALIEINNKSTLSNTSGNYKFIGLSSGQYNITTTHENYFPDIYTINISQNESYNPVLWPKLLQSKDQLNLSYILEWNEEPNYEIHLEKNINNSIIIDISKKSEVNYNFRVLVIDNSEKEDIYNSVGYKIKTLNLNYSNISNVYLIEAAFEKDLGNQSYWRGNLKFIKID